MDARGLAVGALTALLAQDLVQERLPVERDCTAIRAALDGGAYVAAERDARALVSRLTADRGADDLETARASDLLLEALLRNGEGGTASTLALARQVVSVKERHAGPGALDTAVSLHNLAAVHVERGQPSLALPLDERGLGIRSRVLSAESSEVADSLDRLAATLLRLERIDLARSTLARARAIRESRAATEPMALARTLELWCWLLRNGGDYEAARDPLRRVLAIRRDAAPDHPDLAWTIMLAGDLQWLAGDVVAARASWVEAAAMVERAFEAHPRGIALDYRLAMADDALGDRASARVRIDAAVRRADERLAPCNVDRLGLQDYAAIRAVFDGDYPDGRRRYERALAADRACLGDTHSTTATVVFNLGLLAASMGDYAEADRRLASAARAWLAGLGPTHPYVARAWDARADVAMARGDLVRARTLYERALAARRRAATPNPGHVAWTLANLARTYLDAGDLVVADRHLSEALGLFRQVGASDAPDHLARSLSLRGEIESRRGDVAAAAATFADALVARARIFGPSHPLTAQSRADLAAAHLALHETDMAFDEALAAERAGRDHLTFTVRYLPERQAMAYAASRPRGLDVALSVAASGAPIAVDRLFDAAIRSRGVLLDELAVRARLTAATTDAAATTLSTAAVAARQRYANLVVRSLAETVRPSVLEEARRQKDEAERALAERSAEARSEMARADIGLDGVRAALPGGAALVSFVRYQRTLVGAPGSPAARRRAIPSYAAFVLRDGPGAVAFVPLGEARAMEAIVASWRREASGRTLIEGTPPADAERAYRTAARQLRRRMWDPLTPHLSGATRVLVVPDGQLSLASIAALPDATGRYLAEEPVTLHYLSTERDLAVPAAAAARTSLLAVGGAAFDGRPGSDPAPAPAEAPALRSPCEDFGRLRFPALPGSLLEVAAIRRVWPDQDPGAITVLSGAGATETAVKRQLTGRRVVHLATHGFFLGGACVPGAPGMRGVGGLAMSARAGQTPDDNPLLLGGLALAGVNRRHLATPDRDEGILTAEEIAALDLQGTEWAVLSACDTGLGEIKAGEGVFGLRRAFQIAGARTVIMSLWAVEDGAARVWMRALYEGRFRRHLPTADAVGAASLAVLRDRRARGLSSHPFYWAGFVAAGDWR